MRSSPPPRGAGSWGEFAFDIIGPFSWDNPHNRLAPKLPGCPTLIRPVDGGATFARPGRMTRLLRAVLCAAALTGPADVGAQSTTDRALEVIGIAARGADRVKTVWPGYD